MSKELVARLKILVFLLMILCFLAMPVIVYAHCAGLYWSEAVISWFTAGATWRSTSVTTNSYQRWGAPYCYVRDRHRLYKWSNNTWELVAFRTWYDSDEDTGFDHVWEYHEHTFSISSSANYQAKMDGLRYANHASLLPHHQDVDIVTIKRF